MATYVPAKKNTAYIFYASLVDQSNTKKMKSSPTLASGDFKVSTDGGSFANMGTLPTVTPAAGVLVKFSLSTSEMNGDNISVACIDAAGAEWCDVTFNIQTAARQIDDLAFPATSGRSEVVDASGLVDANMVKVGPTGSGTAQTAADIGTKAASMTFTGANKLDASVRDWVGDTIPARNVTGVPKVDLVDVLGSAPNALQAGRFDSYFGAGATDVITATLIAADAIGSSELAASAVQEIIDELALRARNTAQAGAAGTITLDAGASAVNSYYNDSVVYIISGTGVGQARRIVSYVGATKVATIEPNWATNPDNTSVVRVMPDIRVNVARWLDSVPDALSSGKMPSDIKLWLTAAPDALSSGKVAADTKLWLAAAPAALSTNGYVQGMLLRWLTDNAGGTPNALQSGRVDSYIGAVLAGVIAAGSFAANALDAVWSTTTRRLSDGTNIALAKGTGVTGFNDLDTTGVAAAVWNALKSTYNAVGSFGHSTQGVIRQETAQAGASTTITLDSGASATTDFYKDDWIKILTGTGSANQPRRITAYNGSTKVATIDPAWDVTPDATSEFAIFA